MRLLLLLCLLGSAIAMAGNENYQVWMEARPQDSRLDVVPYVAVSEPAQLRYELLYTKLGRAGKASARQSGTLAVACCEPRVLSRLSFSLQEGDRYELSLQAYVQDRLVAAQTLNYP